MSEAEKSETPLPESEELELKLPGESSTLKELGLWAGVLALLTLIVYWPATTGNFIWRDDVNVVNPRMLVDASGLSTSWMGRWTGSATFTRPVYQPVADTFYWLEYQRLGGRGDQGQPSPGAFHITSVIFHALSTILLWLILRELVVPGSWLIAAIFGLHPLGSESVSWISEQPTVLSGLFFLGSVYAYLVFVRFREKDKSDRASGGQGVDPAQTWGLYAGSVVLCLMAILSLPAALVLPAVIALLLWWKKQIKSQDGLLLTPLFVIGLALWFADVDLHKTAGEAVLLQAPMSLQIGAFGHAFWNLGFHLILPFRFSVLYPHGESSSVLTAFAALPLAALVLLYLIRDRVGLGIFVAVAISTLLVGFSLNWFDASRLSNVTDTTSYLAIIPLIAIAVVFISGLKLPGPHPQTVVGISACVLVVLGGFAWSRTHAFESSVALWSDVLRKDPGSSFAEASLAEQLRLAAIEDEKDGEKDQVKLDVAGVIDHADSALKLDPSNSQAERTWANVLVSEGEIASAIAHFERAISLDPTNVQLRDEYGSSLNELGRFKDAIPQLDEALRLDSSSGTTHLLLGEAYYGLGNMDRAIAEQTMALQLNPGDLLARQKMAEAQTKNGSFKEAIANYSVIMQAGPEQMNRPELWRAIAEIKDRQGDYTAAVQYLEPALKLAPDDADLKTELDNEVKKQQHAAATRAATMPTTR